ncbi:MAG: hypothetical protein RL684_31 [Pseudomonadota bacterium]
MSVRALCVVLVGAAATSAAGAAAGGELSLHAVLQDHAVLQRDAPLAVWGNDAPGAEVSISLAGQHATAVADAQGHWRASLAPQPAGGPYELLARDGAGNEAGAHDVWIGDVWLCSGQSNMEMQVRRVANLETEIANGSHPGLHLLHVPHASLDEPGAQFGEATGWQVASPAAVRDFSAACYFMGRELERSVGVALGLVDSTWGGSDIKAWLSGGTLRAQHGYDASLDLLSLHARDAQTAEQGWQKLLEAWWAGRNAAWVGDAAWSQPEFDDSSWPVMAPAGFWEESGVPQLRNFDGVVWFRTSVVLDARQAALPARVQLGPVDDSDATWVNGQRVGGTEGWDTRRDYALPAGLLRAGRNEIVVRVLDSGGGGGLWGAAALRRLSFADGSAAQLPAQWRYRIAGALADLGTPPHAPWQTAVGMSTLGNGMIAPLQGLRLRGVAWYQGENNVYDAGEYSRLLPALIAEWRERFGADIPFLVVQLAGYGPANSVPQDSAWAALRESQRQVVAADPHAGLALTIDIGDRYDIHPTNKQELGRRLGLLAQHLAYGGDAEDSGPVPVGALREGQGAQQRIVVRFSHAAGGLKVLGDARPTGFELCTGIAGDKQAGTQGACHYVVGTVRGETVELAAQAVPGARRVRYAWADSPVVNLVNAQGLPAVPFEWQLR